MHHVTSNFQSTVARSIYLQDTVPKGACIETYSKLRLIKLGWALKCLRLANQPNTTSHGRTGVKTETETRTERESEETREEPGIDPQYPEDRAGRIEGLAGAHS